MYTIHLLYLVDKYTGYINIFHSYRIFFYYTREIFFELRYLQGPCKNKRILQIYIVFELCVARFTFISSLNVSLRSRNMFFYLY